MPRSLKICTAAGDNASDIRTLGIAMTFRLVEQDTLQQKGQRESCGLGQFCLGLGKGPVEPGRQYFNIAPLDRCSTPDAETRRGIPVKGNIVSDTLLLEEAGQCLGEDGLVVNG